jgi:hypothetical protein
MLVRKLAVGMALALAFAAGSAVRAADVDDAQAAVKKLADAANYSWSSAVQGGRGNQTPVEYKAEKDGYSTFTYAGFQGGDPTDIVMKGDKGVAKMADGWKSMAELQKAADDAGGFSPEMMVLSRISSFAMPAAQAKGLLEKAKNVKKEGDSFSGDLAEASAKDLMTFRFPGRGGPGGGDVPTMTISNAKGTIKITTKDGAMNKMEVHLTGTRTFNEQENPVDQTTTITIKDVGSTKVTVPDEAKKKMAEVPASAPATATKPATKP